MRRYADISKCAGQARIIVELSGVAKVIFMSCFVALGKSCSGSKPHRPALFLKACE